MRQGPAVLSFSSCLAVSQEDRSLEVVMPVCSSPVGGWVSFGLPIGFGSRVVALLYMAELIDQPFDAEFV